VVAVSGKRNRKCESLEEVVATLCLYSLSLHVRVAPVPSFPFPSRRALILENLNNRLVAVLNGNGKRRAVTIRLVDIRARLD